MYLIWYLIYKISWHKPRDALKSFGIHVVHLSISLLCSYCLLYASLSRSLSIVSVGTQKTTTIVCTRLNSCATWAVQCRALVVLKLWDCTRIGSELNGGRIVWALSDFLEAFSEQQSKYEMFTYHGVHVLPLCYLACFMSAIIFIFLAWISSLPWPHNGVSEALRLSGHTRIW